MTEVSAFACSNIGVSGAQVFVIKTADGFEARQAVSIFGSFHVQVWPKAL